jgi:hypothetical protein
VFYFFDPFELPVMGPVIDNMKKSLENHPRKVFIAYVNPTLLRGYGELWISQEDREI